MRHNLDVMHIKKSFFENIFNTVMGVSRKIKDSVKSRHDVHELCLCSALHLDLVSNNYPKAIFMLDK
ncbi:hypothetical protein Syun_009457 [Stephania yunnanensis]|uniref:Uncharacterized protein n=1 Tax=Stephania yunnanensis TaxID=152371 RepID=A0AAP0PNJ9_9MAGN